MTTTATRHPKIQPTPCGSCEWLRERARNEFFPAGRDYLCSALEEKPIDNGGVSNWLGFVPVRIEGCPKKVSET